MEKEKPSHMDLLRMLVPSWFTLAAILSAVLLKLEPQQMIAAVVLGGFLTEITYALFFEQTLAPFLKKPSPHLRYLLLASAALLLVLFWIFWFQQF